jgi:short-subunit dehydrogenase
MVSLRGAFVIVTGAASGLGLALTKELSKRGAKVAAVDIDGDALSRLGEHLPGVRTVEADVSARERYLGALDELCDSAGPPSVFVNNAGVARLGAFETASMTEVERMLRVNLEGVIYGTRFALEQMSRDGGIIVNVSSISSRLPSPFLSTYSATKAAVAAFTRSLQAELEQAGSKVRTLLVSPGFLDTAMMKQPGAHIPPGLGALIESPEAAALEIANAIEAGRRELIPDGGGRWLRVLHALSPSFFRFGAKKLLAPKTEE